MKSLFKKRNNIVAVILCLLPYMGFASQIKLAADGGEIVGKLSKTEVNRITLIGDKVKSVKASKSGYEFTNDATSGDVYVSRVSGAIDEPLNVFVISKQGYTYKLLLTPMDIPSEQIFIRNPAIVKDDEIAGDKEPLPYTQEIADLMKAMKKSEVVSGYKILTKRESHFAQNGMKLVLVSTYVGSKYNGVIYELKNKGKEPVPLIERDFATKSVRAVKFDSPVIGIGETTRLYIVVDRS